MKATSAMFLAAAGASLTSATPTPQANVDQSLQCPGPDGNFCVGDTMSTLLSCTAGIPKPAVECSEQTANQPPLGSQEASCYQSSPISGDAACTKNCIVYPSNGGNSYPVPGECTPPPAAASSAAAPPSYPSETMLPTYSSAEAPPSYSSEAPPAPPAYAPESSSAAAPPPMESMPGGFKPPFPFKFPGPMFNMTSPPSAMPPAIPSSSAEAPPAYEASSAPPSMSMPFVPPMMMPTETPALSAPAPEVFTKPLIEASSQPAPEVFTKPLIEASSAPEAPPASSAPPALEVPSPTPATPVSAPPEIPSAPPASVEAAPAPPAMPSPPMSSLWQASSAPPVVPTSSVAPPAFSLPPFLSHIIGNFVHPPSSSLPLPTTDVIATSTIPMTPVTHSYPSPSPEGPGPAYTYSTDSDFSLLPKATLPPYITTVTVGTKTQYHTIFSDCGNGTMVFGSSTIALPTGSAPNEVPLWHVTDGGSLPPLPTITTVPCSEASGWNNTALYTPRKTSASYSYIATLPASATPSAPGSLFSQGDGYDHASGSASSIRQVSGFLLAGLVFGIAAMAL